MGVQLRERKSMLVSPIRITSQRRAESHTTRFNGALQRKCMKKSRTSEALKQAITRATTVFHGPRFTNAMPVVSPVSSRSDPKIRK
jgi:hypothetical protein